MSEKITKEQYAAAVIEFIKLARQDTSGARVAAQVLLSAYNGDAFQLDVSSLCNLDSNNHKLAMTIIKGRYDTHCEPHDLIKNGSQIFGELWDQWIRLHVETRGLPICDACNGRGSVWVNPDDDNCSKTRPCTRCAGKGRVAC
jgi:hypothetical protein